MAFEDAFRSLVLEPLKADPITRQLIAANPGRNGYGDCDYDEKIIAALNQAKTPCATPTLTLWYCYRYLNMHFDQFVTVINSEEDCFRNQVFSKNGDLLLIDIGCGPMTSCLAMADYHLMQYGLPINLHYVGIDNMRPMLDKARDFSRRSDLFGSASTFTFLEDWASLDVRLLKDKVARSGTLIINFSFIFGQPNLTSVHAKELALLVRNVMASCQLKDMFVTFLNIDTPDYAPTQARYFEFRRHLKWKNLPYRVEQYRSFFPKEMGARRSPVGPKSFRYLLVEATLVDASGRPVAT